MKTRGKYSRIGTTLAVVALAATSVAACGTAEAESPDKNPAIVRTDNGPVRGIVETDHRRFQGIPYAASPTGDLRWASPQPVGQWREPFDATTPGDACTQPVDQPIAVPTDNQGPDCLNLNITTPADDTDDKLPVIVWIHGGSFVYGDGASYGAQRMATQGDAVVVSINYRLGAFGFLAHPEIDNGGNFGLEDQQLALSWVRQNIAAFGGDAGNITVMGQSGGGYSICAQLASPQAAGLFDKAIIQSAGCVGPDGVMSLDVAQEAGAELATALNCTEPGMVVECLRGKNDAEVLAVAETGHEGFRPVAGSGVLPTTPIDAFNAGEFNKVPVLHGSNHDEHSGPIAGMELATGHVMTADDYRQQVTETFGDAAQAVLAEYPVQDYDTPSQAATAVFTDSQWSTSAFDTQKALAVHVPVYAYDFADRNAPWFENFGKPEWELGSGHMIELAYLFDYELFESLDKPQQRLSRDVIGYWTQFAAEGEPNHKGAAKWKSFDKKQYVQSLASGKHGIGRTDFAADHHYDFWKSLDI